MTDGARVLPDLSEGFEAILSPEALNFIAKLHREFNPGRVKCLARRLERQKRIDAGEKPGFLKDTEGVRRAEWKVAAAPADLNDRRVEITGPAEAKMMINALNSGAKVFMADLEDSLSPTWTNIIEGQLALKDAVRRVLSFTSPEGKRYALKDSLATLVVRPRGWHLEEKHVLIDGKPVSASLFDFGLYFFHNATESVRRGTGPYFYLPKIESHLEARLWNDVFNFAQDQIGLPRGTIRATVLIETILASFEMDEILYELRDHAAGLNAGRWDYIFSAIKKFRNFPDSLTPDRSQITMTVPFMRAYTELLVRTCHKRGAHAIGGMAAFIPSRKDPAVNETALAKVREDKEREAGDGFDGTWVAHPDLVPIAAEIFNRRLGAKPNQKDVQREEVRVEGSEILALRVPGGQVTEKGVRQNISVALQYLERWLAGTGAAAIFNLMEDAATAEISRAQLWQWRRHGVITADSYRKICDEEIGKLEGGTRRYEKAAVILDGLVLGEWSSDFLTVPAYQHLE